MTMTENDQRVLKALDRAREQHPELAPLLDLHRDLYRVQFQAKADLPEPEMPDDLAMRWRLNQQIGGGIPQLTFERLRLEPEPFAALVAQVAQVLLRYNPDWQLDLEARTADELADLARRIFETWDTLTGPKEQVGRSSDTLPGAEIPPARAGSQSGAGARTVVRAEQEGAQPAFISGDSPEANPLTLTVAAALAPYLQRAAEAIRPHLDLSPWDQGYCPICGGRPNFAVLDEETGARQLMCARCATLWTYSRLRCPFCGAGAEKATYYASEDGFYRLYVCPTCKHYLKAVDLRKARRLVEPLVERLLTVGMDLTARQEGYED